MYNNTKSENDNETTIADLVVKRSIEFIHFYYCLHDATYCIETRIKLK